MPSVSPNYTYSAVDDNSVHQKRHGQHSFLLSSFRFPQISKTTKNTNTKTKKRGLMSKRFQSRRKRRPTTSRTETATIQWIKRTKSQKKSSPALAAAVWTQSSATSTTTTSTSLDTFASPATVTGPPAASSATCPSAPAAGEIPSHRAEKFLVELNGGRETFVDLCIYTQVKKINILYTMK